LKSFKKFRLPIRRQCRQFLSSCYMYKYKIHSNRCVIQFQEVHEPLCSSMCALSFLPSVSLSSSRAELSFIANSVGSFRDYINTQAGHHNKFTYDDGMCLATTIGNQIFHLETRGYTLSWIDPRHIIVVDNKYFLYLGEEHVVKLTSRRTFFITKPIFMQEPLYLAPEYKRIRKLPAELPKSAVYYSLAAVIVHSLFPDKPIQEFHTNVVRPILDTKLYWMLIKCLNTEPSDRVCLII